MAYEMLQWRNGWLYLKTPKNFVQEITENFVQGMDIPCTKFSTIPCTKFQTYQGASYSICSVWCIDSVNGYDEWINVLKFIENGLWISREWLMKCSNHGMG